MATRKVLVGFAAGLFVAGGIAMLPGPAFAQEVSIQVDAKKASTPTAPKSTCKIKVQCDALGVCKGTVDKARIDCVSYANPAAGSISFFTDGVGPVCAGGTKMAEWDVPDPTKRSTRVICLATGVPTIYGPTDQIRGKIENQP
jgi:hypothetical protein